MSGDSSVPPLHMLYKVELVSLTIQDKLSWCLKLFSVESMYFLLLVYVCKYVLLLNYKMIFNVST